MIRRPPISTRTDTLFPSTPLCRSDDLTRHPSELRTGERCDPLADIGRHAAAPERDSPALMFLDGLDHIVGETHLLLHKRRLDRTRGDCINPDFLRREFERPAACEMLDRGLACGLIGQRGDGLRSEEHTSELQALLRNAYSAFCLEKEIINTI